MWFFSSGCYYFLFIHVAGALAEKGCSLDEVAGAAQELADSIGMIYLIIHNVHCDCLAYMYIIVMVSVDHGWVYCQIIVAFSIIPLLLFLCEVHNFICHLMFVLFYLYYSYNEC